MKYVVVSQDRDVYKAFKEALGIEPMKISSVLAATTVLGDKDSTYDFVVIDNTLNGIENLKKLLKKRKINFYSIGDTFEKPISISRIKQVLLLQEHGATNPSKTQEESKDIKKNTITINKNPANEETSSIEQESIFSEIGFQDNSSNVNEEEILIQIKDKNMSSEEKIRPNTNQRTLRPNFKKKKINSPSTDNPNIANEQDGEQVSLNTKKGFNITKIFGKGIKAILTSREVGKEGIMAMPKFKKSKTKIISQQVIGIRRVKGGVGATTIALHLAQAFNSQGIRTCIIDVNFADGGSDLSYYLNLPKIPHWGNFLRNTEDRTSFQESLVDYAGINIMQVPPAMSLIESYLTPEAVIKAMNYARKQFAMVILDLPNEINPIIREVLDSFLTTTVLVTSGHISELNRLEKLNDLDNPILVMNGAGTKNLDKFKEYLDGIENFVTVPEDTELYRTLEKKKIRSINTPYGVAINNLALKIFEL